ncbi:hypothetical protein D3C71_1625500 [compost metagenome]
MLLNDVQQRTAFDTGGQVTAIEQQVCARAYRLAQCGQRSQLLVGIVGRDAAVAQQQHASAGVRDHVDGRQVAMAAQGISQLRQARH